MHAHARVWMCVYVHINLYFYSVAGIIIFYNRKSDKNMIGKREKGFETSNV